MNKSASQFLVRTLVRNPESGTIDQEPKHRITPDPSSLVLRLKFHWSAPGLRTASRDGCLAVAGAWAFGKARPLMSSFQWIECISLHFSANEDNWGCINTLLNPFIEETPCPMILYKWTPATLAVHFFKDYYTIQYHRYNFGRLHTCLLSQRQRFEVCSWDPRPLFLCPWFD